MQQATDVDVDAEEQAIMTELGKQWEKYKAEFDRRIQEEVREEFRQEGRQEGRREGTIDALRETILTVLRARHLPSSKALATRIKTCTDDATLKRWLERAVVANTPAEVFTEG
jgi:predicted transposase YdaD